MLRTASRYLLIFCCLFLVFGRVAFAADKTTSTFSTANRSQNEVLQQILGLLNEAVITDLDAKISLESAKVQHGRVRLQGVSLHDLRIGIKLSARGAKKLANLVEAQLPASGSTTENDIRPLLQILKLGLYDDIELMVRLRELRVRRVAVDADALALNGLLLQVGAKPINPVTGKPQSDTWSQLLHLLRNTALQRIKAHAGLDELLAKRLKAQVEGVALEGFSVGLVLRRNDEKTAVAPL
ncbi:MAG TPA: hypothetical protein VF719_00365 [Abditibacteriaceae bacterium]|jgi:hypothetical protein